MTESQGHYGISGILLFSVVSTRNGGGVHLDPGNTQLTTHGACWQQQRDNSQLLPAPWVLAFLSLTLSCTMDDMDATILRALAANDPSMTDDSGLLGEDEFLEQLLKVTGTPGQEGYEIPSSSSFDIEPIEYLSNLTHTNDVNPNENNNNFVVKSTVDVNRHFNHMMSVDKNDVGTKGLIDFLSLCETQLDAGALEEDPFEPVPIKPKRERRKRRSVPNLAQARLPAVEFIRNASLAMQPSRNGMDEDFMENSKKLDMFLQENNTLDLEEMEDAARVTTGKRRREHNQGRNSLPTMHIGASGVEKSNNGSKQQQPRPAPLLSQADLEGLDLTDYEDNHEDAESGPPILDQVPLLGIHHGLSHTNHSKSQGAETHSMHERLLRISGDGAAKSQGAEPMQTEGGRVRRASGGSLGGVEERLRRISVETDDEDSSTQRTHNGFSHQSSMGETHSMEERLRRISKDSTGSAFSEPMATPRFAQGGPKRYSPTPKAETHSMEERLRRISADNNVLAGAETHSMEERLRRISAEGLMANSSRAETHSMEERLRRISADASDNGKRGGSVTSSHGLETHSMEERLRRISGSNRNLSGPGSAEDRIRRISGESGRSLAGNAARGSGWGLTLSPKSHESGHSNHGLDDRLQGFSADLMVSSAKLDKFLATRGGEEFTDPIAYDLEDHPAPKRRKSLEQQRSSLPPMHISTDGGRPQPLLSKKDLADLELSDFDDSTDDDMPTSSNDNPLRFSVTLEKKSADRRKAFRKRPGRQNSLPDLHALEKESSKADSKQTKRSESSSPIDGQHDPLGLLQRLRNLMKRTEKTQQALQEWDKLNGLPKSHSQTMVNSSRSRRQIQEGRIIPKWDGTPLINEETELGKPKPRAKLNIKSAKK